MNRALDVYTRAAKMPNIAIRGVQMHIGSQITDTKPFVEAIAKVTPLILQLKQQFALEFFSVGGGIGIVYESSLASGNRDWWKDSERVRATTALPLTISDYAAAVLPLLKKIGLRVLLEPGRLLVGNAGVLLSRVRYLKQAEQKKFVIVDAGMNDLIRPALYQSYHEIVPVRETDKSKREKVDVVGPVCESGDFFAQDRELPQMKEGDLVALDERRCLRFRDGLQLQFPTVPAEVLGSGRSVFLNPAPSNDGRYCARGGVELRSLRYKISWKRPYIHLREADPQPK